MSIESRVQSQPHNERKKPCKCVFKNTRKQNRVLRKHAHWETKFKATHFIEQQIHEWEKHFPTAASRSVPGNILSPAAMFPNCCCPVSRHKKFPFEGITLLPVSRTRLRVQHMYIFLLFLLLLVAHIAPFLSTSVQILDSSTHHNTLKLSRPPITTLWTNDRRNRRLDEAPPPSITAFDCLNFTW